MGLRDIDSRYKSKGFRKAFPLLTLVLLIVAVSIAIVALSSSGPAPPTGAVVVANETAGNDTETGPVEEEPEEPELPDLSISKISFSQPEIRVGEAVNILVEVRNRGELAINKSEILAYIDNELIGSGALANLPPGSSTTVSIEWKPDAKYLGEQTIVVKGDPYKKLAEESEENNEESKGIDVGERVFEDVSDKLRMASKAGIGSFWYTTLEYFVPPKPGSIEKYFDFSKKDEDSFYLIIALAGFKEDRINNLSDIKIPDSSDDGWGFSSCIKKTASADNCIWNGPQIMLTLEIEDKYLVAKDTDGGRQKVYTTSKGIKNIELSEAQRVDWPTDIQLFKVFGSGSPDEFIPAEFYEVKGTDIYFHPVQWNPGTLKAVVYPRVVFLITLD
jgi:hypothetical protein